MLHLNVRHERSAFRLSEHGSTFLDKIGSTNIKYDRGGKAGEGYLGVKEVLQELDKVPNYPAYYTPKERAALHEASAEVQARMRIKVSTLL